MPASSMLTTGISRTTISTMWIGKSGHAGNNAMSTAVTNTVRRLVDAITRAFEVVLSRRGLPVSFLALAAILARGGWIRPPLSPDISALHLPLGIDGLSSADGESILHGPRPIPVDSAGVVLLAVIGVGVV